MSSGRGARAGFVIVFVIVAAWVCAHAAWMAGYLGRTSAIAFEHSTGTSPRAQLQQGFSLDGLMWIDHAIRLDEQESWRLRYTHFDNPPHGREVHWSSGWAWWIRGLGHVWVWFTHEPLPAAIERAAVWANLPVLLVGMLVLGLWVTKRWGALAGSLVVLGMGWHRDFYEAFHPGNPDHHGPITLCVLGMLIGVLSGGAGWFRASGQATESGFLPKGLGDVKRAAIFSAIWGGVGLWMSAASLVVPIALIGTATVLASWCLAGDLRAEQATFAPVFWRRWGQLGAGVSVCFYLLEYFPRLPLERFEVNHPLYALAWWAGAEIVATLVAWRAEGRAALSRSDWIRAGAAAGTLGGVAVIFIAMRESGLVFAQPFMDRLYRHVDELRPLWEGIRTRGLGKHFDHAVIYLLPIMIAPWLLLRRASAHAKLVLAVTAGLAAALTLQGWWQTRWLLIAGSAQIALVVVLLGLVVGRRNAGAASIWAFMGGVALYAAGPWLLGTEIVAVERLRDVRRDECMSLFYRDVARRLGQENAGHVVLLASPNASVGTAYYGAFSAVGTLYWENHDGLERAARIWTAQTDAEAARLIREGGVTHVLVSWPQDFVAEYYDAMRPAWPIAETFARRLEAFRLPVWLRPVSYAPPVEMKGLGLRGDLYAVDFAQTEAQAGLLQGRFLLKRGLKREALDSFAVAARAADVDAAMELAWVSATSADATLRDGARALRWAKVASEARPESVRARMVLAAAFAENGRIAEANGAIFYAMQLAEEQGRGELLPVLARQADSYREARPWRE